MGKRVSMFCGKGGVGKTTCAAATALHYAVARKKTLILSTDLTPSLRDIFEIESGGKVVKVTKGLYLHEISYEAVKKLWDEDFGSDAYDVFSVLFKIGYQEFVDLAAAILPGLMDEFMVDYIKELSESGEYETIVWDTAPAGQTLRLLGMQSTLASQHLEPRGRLYLASKVTRGKEKKRSLMEVMRGWEERARKDMEFLRTGVEFNFVAIPEALAVRQLDGIFAELRRYGLEIDRVIINQVIQEPDSEFLRGRMLMQRGHIQEIAGYGKPCRLLPLFPYEIRGIERLKEVEKILFTN
ncbi:hypothetical protein COV28_02935 [candidate division WWE3 bacterium CG10_big_fil_rev_8_21_14_0_10_48_23]|nr:MAG: hypothetical protein COV28_02935 [candidate division WWE3 bacterium CG10_big_fil_rev_8_21_14_0_10_48_23]